MTNNAPALSRALTMIGALMILAGLGWGIWRLASAPPPPTISDAGAVVVAVTARVERVPAIATITPTAPSVPRFMPGPPGAGEYRLRTLPELAPEEPTPRPTRPTATPLPPTPSPTPSGPPPAAEPPARIVAPDIALDADVVPMTWEMVDRRGVMISEWIVPANAAGWHANSALPGNDENVVLSGHNNIDGKVFRYLVDLEPGNKVTIYAGEVAYEYTVTEKYILKEAGMPLEVRQKNAQWMMPAGEERLTLVTCWPYEWPGNSHRVVVVARPSDYFEALAGELDLQ
ncbi:MAG: sortase [Anaerolineaceae bacterium]|nr:sortase [Anaerolineaceae bacterium]